MKKSLYLLLLLLFPIGLQAQSEVIVLHPDEGKAEVNEAEYTRIFLAGTIDMAASKSKKRRRPHADLCRLQ